MKSTIKSLMHIIICGILLFSLSCKEKVTTPTVAPEKSIKEITGFATALNIQISKKIYSLVSMLPNDAAYRDEWWLFTVDIPDGRMVQVKLQFQDVSGNIQQTYDTKATKYMRAIGQAIGSNDLMNYSVEFFKTGFIWYPHEELFCFNGSYNYKGYKASISATDYLCLPGIPKLPDFYPDQGGIGVTVYVANGSRVTVTYNGTRFASATFTYQGVLYHFIIDLDTGQIS